MRISAIILAAGRSSRFDGGHKLLSEIGGVALIRRVATAVAAAPVEDIILVTASDGGDVLKAAGEGRWRSVINADNALGLSSSLQAGLHALNAGTGGALIVLGDMPALSAGLIANLCEMFKSRAGSAIVFPQDASGQQGNPVLWPRALFPELTQLTSDHGGKKLLTTYAHLCQPITVSNTDAFTDIDTRADLERFRTAPR